MSFTVGVKIVVVIKNIVLLHGWGADTKKLEPLKSELEKLSWSVFIPRMPGFEKPPPKNAWTVGDYADFIKNEVANKFKDKRYVVFGHSFGGRIALKLAASKSRSLSGVILCATAGISRTNIVKRVFFFVLAKIGRIFMVFKPLASFWKKFVYKLAGEHDYEKTKGVMRETFKNVVSEDLKPLLTKIKIPVLLLWGEKDSVTPVKDAYYINDAVFGSKLITFKRDGHRLPYEKPKELAKEIDKWITQLPS